MNRWGDMEALFSPLFVLTKQAVTVAASALRGTMLM